MSQHSKVLGVDWGSKNIGLAVSDETAKFAFPYKVLEFKNFEETAKVLQSIIEKEKIGSVVMGLPKNFSQQDTDQTREIKQACRILSQKLNLNIEFQDEILTSKLAEKHSVKNTHASAAALILQSYLDKNRGV